MSSNTVCVNNLLTLVISFENQLSSFGLNTGGNVWKIGQEIPKKDQW